MRQLWILFLFCGLAGGCASSERRADCGATRDGSDSQQVAWQIDPRALDTRPRSALYGGDGFTELSVQIGRDEWPSTLRDQPSRATGVYYLDYYDQQGRPTGGFGGFGWGDFIQRRVRIRQTQTYSR